MKRQKIVVTFTDARDADVVGTAMLGGTYKRAFHNTARTLGQIAYRLKLAREKHGLPKGVGFAKQWRDGSSEISQQVYAQIMPSLRAQIIREMSKWRARPTPKTVKD